LTFTGANVADVDYVADRGLDRFEMVELSNCAWVTERRNVVLIGASVAGKNWVGCALEAAACNIRKTGPRGRLVTSMKFGGHLFGADGHLQRE